MTTSAELALAIFLTLYLTLGAVYSAGFYRRRIDHMTSSDAEDGLLIACIFLPLVWMLIAPFDSIRPMKK